MPLRTQGAPMPELTVPEAAAALGVHHETIRRRIRRGELTARKDERGRVLVDVPRTHAGATHTPTHTQAEAVTIAGLLTALAESQAALKREQENSAQLLERLKAAEGQVLGLLATQGRIAPPVETTYSTLPEAAQHAAMHAERHENRPAQPQVKQTAARRVWWRFWRR
jgi:excisionase family DNA binding protein